jgi:hypothetical protein
MAGYSRRTLIEKLGIKEGMSIAILNPPRGYRVTLGKLPSGVKVVSKPTGVLGLIQLFTPHRMVLETEIARLLPMLEPSGALWVSWPKKASGVSTDITEDVVRALALPAGLVDVKVAAIDDVWSGLKLVRRLRNR